MGGVAEVNLAAVVCEVGEHDTKVDETGEDAGAETTDGGRGNLGEVDGADDGRLAYTETGDEATSVDGAEVSVVGHEDGNTDDPDDAELTGSPDTADLIANDEGTVCGISG